MFDKTFSAALSAGEDAMAADAAARIAQEALWAARLPEFDRWQRVAQALAHRVGARPASSAFIDQLGCMSNHYTGKVAARASACLRELAVAQGRRPPNEWLVTTLGIAASEAGAARRSDPLARARRRAVARRERRRPSAHARDARVPVQRPQRAGRLQARARPSVSDALARLQKSAPDDKTAASRACSSTSRRPRSSSQHVDVARPLLEAAMAGGDEEVKLDAQHRAVATSLASTATSERRRRASTARRSPRRSRCSGSTTRVTRTSSRRGTSSASRCSSTAMRQPRPPSSRRADAEAEIRRDEPARARADPVRARAGGAESESCGARRSAQVSRPRRSRSTSAMRPTPSGSATSARRSRRLSPSSTKSRTSGDAGASESPSTANAITNVEPVLARRRSNRREVARPVACGAARSSRGCRWRSRHRARRRSSRRA